MPKVIFIEPKAPNLHIFSQFVLPRLGSIILATIARQEGWDAKVYIEEEIQIDWNEIATADLVGVSTITPTAPRAYAISDRVRGLGIPTIIGGPHVTFLPEEALQHSDYVIRGEGEIAFRRLLRDFPSRESISLIPSLSYQNNGKRFHNPTCPPMINLDYIPYPDFSLLARPLKPIAGKTIIPIQTSRGCPYDCSFCSVTGMFGRKYRFRSADNVMEELSGYNDHKNFIFFYDDNFAANQKHTQELLERMIAAKLKFKWSTQVRTDISKDKNLIKLMKRAGCHTVFIGFESVNPQSLKSMKKNQSIEDIRRASETFRTHGIHVHGMFVYGFDDDDWATVKSTVRFAKHAKLSSSQFLILTPLPGTRSYQQLDIEGRIQFRDWSLYDAHHVVFKPKRFSLYDLQWAQVFSHKRFYSIKESIKKFLQWRWVDLGVAHYARGLNHKWRRRNKSFLKAVKLLKPQKEGLISIDYQKEVILD
jgi:radical SAM superfamily enzyme YgiQ (UPF0313 family)